MLVTNERVRACRGSGEEGRGGELASCVPSWLSEYVSARRHDRERHGELPAGILPIEQIEQIGREGETRRRDRQTEKETGGWVET